MKKNKAPFYYVLLELRLRLSYIIFSLFITFIISYIYSFDLIFLIVQPFFLPKHFIFTDITEALATTLNICIIASIHTIFPFFLYQIWSFMIPGFFQKERKKIFIFLLFTFFLTAIGGLLIFSNILPEIYKFLFTFEIKKEIITIQLEARILSYVDFTFKFYLYFMFFFQIPLIYILLFEYKILRTKSLINSRKYFYFFSLLLAAFISPPDLVAQLTFAFFFSITYELGLWLGFVYEKKRIE